MTEKRNLIYVEKYVDKFSMLSLKVLLWRVFVFLSLIQWYWYLDPAFYRNISFFIYSNTSTQSVPAVY